MKRNTDKWTPFSHRSPCVFVCVSYSFRYIARKTGTFSTFGAFLDPVSDKLMVTVILILVTYQAPPEGLCAQFPALVPFSAGGK